MSARTDVRPLCGLDEEFKPFPIRDATYQPAHPDNPAERRRREVNKYGIPAFAPLSLPHETVPFLRASRIKPSRNVHSYLQLSISLLKMRQFVRSFDHSRSDWFTHSLLPLSVEK